MLDVKVFAVSAVAVLSVFLQPGIRAQPTIGSTSEDTCNFCSQLEDECEFQAVENARLLGLLESERQTTKTLENVAYSQTEENNQLKVELEKKQLKIETLESERRRARPRELQSVTATFINSFDHSRTHHGIIKVEDKIYVANHKPSRISVYEDLIGFRFITDIALNDTIWPEDIVYSNESKCVYIRDFMGSCIWAMTRTGEHRLTKWLTSVTRPWTLSLSSEGQVLVLRHSFIQYGLEIYNNCLNATLIRRLHLPQDIKEPKHVVQTSTGNFIISHRLNYEYTGPWVISQLTNDGQLINRFIPRNQSENLNAPEELTLDSDNNRLFVADFDNHRVILFDSIDLTWSQVLLSQAKNGISLPFRLFYDASKKHLFVAQNHANVTVYEIN